MCATCNCHTDDHILFIFDTAIDDPHWKNHIDPDKNQKIKMSDGSTPMAVIPRYFVKI